MKRTFHPQIYELQVGGSNIFGVLELELIRVLELILIEY